MSDNAATAARCRKENEVRHTITVTIEVEASTRSRKQVVSELLGLITDVQERECHSCDVAKDGREVNHKRCTISVASAEADGATTTAGWAV